MTSIILILGTALSALFSKRAKYIALCAIGFSFIATLFSYDISYIFGNFTKIIGIEHKLSSQNYIFILTALLIAFIGSFKLEQKLYPVYMLFLLGSIGMLITNDIFNLYVFLEISSLASYAITADTNKLAAIRYLILGTIAACFILLGIGFIYMETGQLNIDEIHFVIIKLDHPLISQIGLSFIIIGALIKAGIFPFNLWAAYLYKNIPLNILPVLGSIGAKIPLFILIKLSFLLNKNLSLSLEYIGYASIIISAVFAYFEKDLIKALAFSSSSQAGYIIFAISLQSQMGIKAAIIMMVIHALAKAAIFTSLSRLVIITNFAIIFGIPFSGMFIGKYLLIKEAITHSIISASIISLSIIFSFLYMNHIITMVKKDNKPNLYAIVLTGINIMLGIYFYF